MKDNGYVRGAWEVNPVLKEKGAISLRLTVALALVAALLTLGTFQQLRLNRFQRERDSLTVAASNLDLQLRAGRRVDTLRADTVREVRTRATTVVDTLRQTVHDTVTLRQINTVVKLDSTALALDSARITFWKNASDSLKSQRDEARHLLAIAPTPPKWEVAATLDQQLKVNLCAMKPVARILGVNVSVGACYRS